MSPEAKPTRPIDIYVRFSQVGARDKASIRTLDEQEQACRDQLKLDGLEAGLVFSDNAVSGGKRSRPAFDKVLERARTGESGGIIVYDLSRFGRYDSMALDIIELEKAGATFLAVKDKIDTSSASSRAFLKIMEVMAVMYREQVEERLMLSQANAVARGVHISPNVPPGYDRGKDGVLVPNPQHRVTIANAYKMAAQGSSRAEIARYLTKRGLPSAGRPITWHASRIGRLLANPVYKGQARGGHGLTNDHAHTAIVDAVTWARAQREQADPELLIPEKSEWLLAGFVRCASCRYAMRSMPGRKSTAAVYRCHCTNSEHKCRAPTTAAMAPLDDYVYAQWVEKTWDMHEGSSSERPADTNAEDELAAANGEYAELQAAEDELDPVSYARAETKILARIKEAEKALAATDRPSVDALLEQWAADGGPEKMRAEVEAVMRGEKRVLDDMTPEAVKLMRQAMARDIRAVFVRKAQSTGRGSKMEDRVKILWAGDELPEMPRRGLTFKPRPYVFPDENSAERVA